MSSKKWDRFENCEWVTLNKEDKEIWHQLGVFERARRIAANFPKEMSGIFIETMMQVPAFLHNQQMALGILAMAIYSHGTNEAAWNTIQLDEVLRKHLNEISVLLDLCQLIKSGDIEIVDLKDGLNWRYRLIPKETPETPSRNLPREAEQEDPHHE